MHFKNTVGALIREKRKEKGMTQLDLATCMGFDFQVISNYENGRRMPSIEWIFRCCECLGVEPDEFVNELNKRIR